MLDASVQLKGLFMKSVPGTDGGDGSKVRWGYPLLSVDHIVPSKSLKGGGAPRVSGATSRRRPQRPLSPRFMNLINCSSTVLDVELEATIRNETVTTKTSARLALESVKGSLPVTMLSRLREHEGSQKGCISKTSRKRRACEELENCCIPNKTTLART